MDDLWDLINTVELTEAELPSKPAAVLAALFEDDDTELRLVLTKRPDTMPTHPGDIAFPGGRWHPEDRTPVETALREAWEEVGIAPASVEVLGYLPPLHTVGYSRLVVPVVGRMETLPELKLSDQEVERVFLPKVSDLMRPERWSWEKWRGRRIWFYPLEGETLWGATAAMIRTLLRMEN